MEVRHGELCRESLGGEASADTIRSPSIAVGKEEEMITRGEMKVTDPSEALRAASETKLHTDANRHEVDCSQCGGHFFVDDATYDRIAEVLAVDPAGVPYVCQECEDVEEI